MQKTLRKKTALLKKLLAISLSFFSIAIFCFSCYEPIEGCLDYNSSNYDVSADRACDSCCVYPNFNFSISQVFNKADFSLRDTLINIQGNEIILTDYAILMSGFKAVKDNVEFTVADTFELECLTSSIVPNYSTNDLIVITKNSAVLTAGSFKHSDTFNELRFLIGLDECFHYAQLEDLEDFEEINEIDTLFTESVGFTNFYFEFSDSIRVSFDGVPDIISFSMPTSFNNEPGQPLVVDLNIDFGVWFSDLDLVEDSVLSLKEKIKANSVNAITVSQ